MARAGAPNSRLRHPTEFAAASPWLYADVDHDQIPEDAPQPTVIIESSPGRWQAFWRLDQTLEPAEGVALNQRLAARIRADPSGTDATQVLRVPGTRNHKYNERPFVRLLTVEGPTHTLASIRQALPEERRQPAAPVIGDIREGERNSTLASLAGTMRRRGFSEEAILLALQQENLTRCLPPLDDDEVASIAASIGRYEPADAARSPAAPLVEPIIYRADELMLREFPEPRWAVPDFIPEGLSALAGKPKMGKSWLALDLALGVALGQPVLGGVKVEQGDVLALFLEDGPRRLQDRIAKLLVKPLVKPTPEAPAKEGVIRLAYSLDLPDPRRLIIANRWPKLDEKEKGLELIEQWIEEHPQARLIIIDTFGKVKPKPGQGSAYDADTQALGPLQQMALERNIAVLVLTHLRKEKVDDPLEMINASMGFAGALDGALIMNRVRGQADATLFVTGRDVKEDKDHALSWNSETARWSLSGEASEARMTGERAQVLRVIRQAEGWISARSVAQTIGKEDKAVRYLAGKLVEEGLIESSSRGYRESRATPGTPSSPSNPGTPSSPSRRVEGGGWVSAASTAGD